jgi:hypothetical protein
MSRGLMIRRGLKISQWLMFSRRLKTDRFWPPGGEGNNGVTRWNTSLSTRMQTGSR